MGLQPTSVSRTRSGRGAIGMGSLVVGVDSKAYQQQLSIWLHPFQGAMTPGTTPTKSAPFQTLT